MIATQARGRRAAKYSITGAVVVAALVALAGCTEQHRPQATNVEWKVDRAPNKRSYHLTGQATFSKGLAGWYLPTITLLDDKGCNRGFELDETQIASAGSTGLVVAKFDKVLDVHRPVATANFNIRYEELAEGQVSKTGVFDETRTVDATVHAPGNPVDACGNVAAERSSGRPTKQQLRERAKIDPDGADAEAIANMSRNELLATSINSAGFLCARVTDMYPRGGDIIVHCVEYRSGKGRVSYRVNAQAGSVEQLD